jgi:23S rRNA pseudouridine2605 synthase
MWPMKSKGTMTLDRILSRFGLGSRHDSREAVLAGRLKVNGRVLRDPDAWIQPGKDVIHLDGEILRHARKRYYLFYKPKGVITSHGDPSKRKTIYDCLGAKMPWVAPVGRLDKDTSGLILLTNDTDFANLVTDPAQEIPKTYLVKANCIVGGEALAAMEEGVRMKRGDWARPRSVRRIEDRGRHTWLEIVLTEGKNREVRRLMEAVGFSVLKLVRTAIGTFTLQDLQVGGYRELSSSEIAGFLASTASKPARSSPQEPGDEE